MIDPAEKAAMAKILNAMNGFDPACITESASAPQSMPQQSVAAGTVAPPACVSTEAGQAMKNILSRFYDATEDTVERLYEGSETVPELRKAMVTRRTPTGTSVGEWSIDVNTQGKRSFYDVRNNETGTIIAADMSIYEAAEALVGKLNEGMPINSRAIRDILEAEEDYSRHLEDAIRFRHSGHAAERKGDDHKASVMEARYDNSKLRALQAKDRIKSML